MIIQACQVAPVVRQNGCCDESDPIPLQYSDPNKDQHITLTRPHTVLLHATGGVTYRGQFTGAMAEELHSADGSKDIYAMFNDAAAKLREETDCDPPKPTI